MIAECRSRNRKGQIVNNVARILRENPKSAKGILYELCVQVEDALVRNEHDIPGEFFEEQEGHEEGDEGKEELSSEEDEQGTLTNHFLHSVADDKGMNFNEVDVEVNPEDF